MPRWSRYILGSLIIVTLVVGAFFVGRAHPSNQAVVTSTLDTDNFYLVIGGSSSLGTQPTGIATRNAHRTLNGYANDVVAIEVARGVSMYLHQIGCYGETTQSMLDTVGGDHCYTPPVTQLSLARNFLTSRKGQAGVVSIDLGLNNVRPCISHATISTSCFDQQLALISRSLPIVLRDLTDVAGPRVRFAGFEYEDPFLARYFDGPTGPAFARQSLVDINALNAVLEKIYSSAKIPIVNLPATFQSNNNTPVVIDNVGVIPQNVADICLLTWMCQPSPFGPDDHPNNAGYMRIADAIVATLPKSW